MLQKNVSNDIRKYGEIIYDAIYLSRNKYPGIRFWVSHNLNGACAIASFFLFKKLREKGYKLDFVEGLYLGEKPHCWLNINQCIVDITATQFNVFDKVIILGTGRRGNYIPKSTNRTALNWVKSWRGQSPFKYSMYWQDNSAELRPLPQRFTLTRAG